MGSVLRDVRSSVKDPRNVEELVCKYNGVKKTNSGDQTSDFKISKLCHLLKEMIEIARNLHA